MWGIDVSVIRRPFRASKGIDEVSMIGVRVSMILGSRAGVFEGEAEIIDTSPESSIPHDTRLRTKLQSRLKGVSMVAVYR